jgi:hypothetical protein
MAILKNTTVTTSDSLRLPVGGTAARPTPAQGQTRFNSDLGQIETYDTVLASWQNAGPPSVTATGGNAVYDIVTEGTPYRVHVFGSTGNSTFTVTRPGRVEYLIVAGGGGGSGNFYDDGAGGGAGGLITGVTTVTPQAYTVTVGAGGPFLDGGGGGGGNTVAFGLTALGGGGGAGHRSTAPGGGGSGGGAGGSFLNDGINVEGGPAAQPGSASGGFGNNGGRGGINNTLQGGGYPQSGGGGGAGSAGSSPPGGGRGGAGLPFSISGFSTFYAGGGGGISAGLGGIGGGAQASTGRSGAPARPATPNTGGGGGGGRPNDSGLGSNGGSGIVIIRYPLRQTNKTSLITEVRDTSIIANFNLADANAYPGNGSQVYDTRFSNTIGILVNTPVVREVGTHRASFNYNGANQHIRLENFKTAPSSQITCEAWVFPQRAPSTGTVRGAAWSNSASTYLGIIDSTDGGATHSLHWALQTSNSRTGGLNGSIPRNNWSHIVGTYDGARTRGYVNGVLVYDVAQTGTVSGGTWYIGTYGQGINDGTHNWEGNISMARMYSRALTAQEIINNLNVNRWRFGI